MLPIRNVTYTKCYLYKMLPIPNVTIRKCTRQNVTIRKCTVRNVTDPSLTFENPFFSDVLIVSYQLN